MTCVITYTGIHRSEFQQTQRSKCSHEEKKCVPGRREGHLWQGQKKNEVGVECLSNLLTIFFRVTKCILYYFKTIRYRVRCMVTTHRGRQRPDHKVLLAVMKLLGVFFFLLWKKFLVNRSNIILFNSLIDHRKL